MTHMTVRYDGSGRLNSLDLDSKQAAGDACAVCGRNRQNLARLTKFGEVGAHRTPVVVCEDCEPPS